MKSFSPIQMLELGSIPPALRTIKDAPKRLYVQGSNLALLEECADRGLAIVGTRDATPRALRFCEQTVLALKGSRLVIVSGLARGIDFCAHQAALKAGLPTIAIVAGGLDQPYPAGRDEFRHDILHAGGLIVSEQAPGLAAFPGDFVERNRLIAGVSRATWVVQAPARSGALSTAARAFKQGRGLYATPCFPGELGFEGNRRLLQSVEGVVPVWDIESFGQSWLELSTHRSRLATPLGRGLSISSDARELLGRLPEAASTPRAVLQASSGWMGEASGRFYAALRELLEGGLILDENGLVLKNLPYKD